MKKKYCIYHKKSMLGQTVMPKDCHDCQQRVRLMNGWYNTLEDVRESIQKNYAIGSGSSESYNKIMEAMFWIEVELKEIS